MKATDSCRLWSKRHPFIRFNHLWQVFAFIQLIIDKHLEKNLRYQQKLTYIHYLCHSFEYSWTLLENQNWNDRVIRLRVNDMRTLFVIMHIWKQRPINDAIISCPFLPIKHFSTFVLVVSKCPVITKTISQYFLETNGHKVSIKHSMREMTHSLIKL